MILQVIYGFVLIFVVMWNRRDIILPMEKMMMEAMDNLLLTHGWRRFKWETILSPSASFAPKFIPEQNGHLITAKVVNAADKSVAKNVDCFLSSPGLSICFLYMQRQTNAESCSLMQIRYFGPGEVIVQAGRDSVNRYQVDVLTPFAEEHVQSRAPPFTLEKRREKDLLDKSIAMQAQNIYFADSIRKFNPPASGGYITFFWKS